MQRAQPIDELEDAVDERRALAIAEGAQRVAAAQMLVAIGVAARAAERTFARDFNREIRAPASEDLAPGANDAVHLSTLTRRAGPRQLAKGRACRPLPCWLHALARRSLREGGLLRRHEHDLDETVGADEARLYRRARRKVLRDRRPVAGVHRVE